MSIVAKVLTLEKRRRNMKEVSESQGKAGFQLMLVYENFLVGLTKQPHSGVNSPNRVAL